MNRRRDHTEIILDEVKEIQIILHRLLSNYYKKRSKLRIRGHIEEANALAEKKLIA